ncbi:HAD family hydrolase [Alienimonas sp. DA493]|uniref:HAD family hydrolase n=1 Tax=Alienimonas sp. DA493 TaxID=3373605 RepID=UPI00375406F0
MHAILFDIDGTLLLAGSGGPAMAAAAEAAFGAALDEYDVHFHGRTDTAIAREYHAAHEAEHTPESHRVFQEAYLDALPGVLAEGDGRVLPGVPALLEALAAREDVLLGLLTGNYAKGAAAKLSHFGLAQYFDLSVGGYGDHTPDRNEVARTALEALPPELQANPKAVWVVGDTPADVTCGKSIGAKTLAVATGHYSRDELADSAADALLDDFSDTAATLRALGLS